MGVAPPWAPRALVECNAGTVIHTINSRSDVVPEKRMVSAPFVAKERIDDKMQVSLRRFGKSNS